MKSSPLILAAAGLATATKPLVDSKKLQDSITIEGLIARSEKLQEFGNRYPAINRLTGQAAHEDTVNYIVEELEKTGNYDIELQPFSAVIQISGQYALDIDGGDYAAGEFQYSPSGTVETPLVVVSNLGCDAADFPATVAGSIGLVSRGTCPFGQKSALAKQAGAVGLIIYENIVGGAGTAATGTLGATNAIGPYVPTIGIGNANGTSLVTAINGGQQVIASLDVTTDIQNLTSRNVLATTKGGNKDTILALGAHTDSVGAGPGINDDGSGTVAILEVAKQLSHYSTNNAVRFGFWAAEEEGLLGSTFYVNSLSNSSRSKIRAYLNFDMIASPNYFNGIYDGDGSQFNLTGPAGSAEIEHLLEEYFTPYNYTGTEFSGRSDYAAFINAGIPSGGTFTGAEALKTEAQAVLFGGQAGVAYDVNYHKAGDTIDNLNKEAFIVHSKAIAHSVAFYATSFDSLPPKESSAQTKRKRDLRRAVNEADYKDTYHNSKRAVAGHTHAGCLGKKLLSSLDE